MKRLIVFVSVLICVLSIVVYAQQSEQKTELEIVEPNITIAEFSYVEDSARYVEGEPGVKISGFVNTTKVDADFDNISDVAKNECTIEWSSCRTYLDTAECIWKVVFYNEGTVGGDQTVYLDYDGKTVLIVYGE